MKHRSQQSAEHTGGATLQPLSGAVPEERQTDELLLEVPDAETGPVRTLVREEMVGAYPLDPPLAVDVGIGDNWAEAKG